MSFATNNTIVPDYRPTRPIWFNLKLPGSLLLSGEEAGSHARAQWISIIQQLAIFPAEIDDFVTVVNTECIGRDLYPGATSRLSLTA